MKIFDGQSWRDGFLDHHRGPDQVRVRPTRWLVLERVEDLHIVPPRSLRKTLDYARHLGVVRTARKVASRLGERSRNDDVCACGIGEIVESDAAEEVGSWVVFAAPVAPLAVERVVVERALMREAEAMPGGLRRAEWVGSRFFDPLVGWSRFSGAPLPIDDGFFVRCRAALEEAAWGGPEEFERSEVSEVRDAPESDAARAVTVFGWGHHARTQIGPSIPDDWTLARVHEIDPRLEEEIGVVWDTAPHFRAGERADVVCVATYHATHAELTAAALRQGATVVVEKPAVTAAGDLENLLEAWAEPSRVFTLFHKRYGAIAGYLREDLEVGRAAVDMHATVYEIPLPRRHWYRWPSSGGRVVNNGCHWIDQFLWLNPDSEVVASSARSGPRGQIVTTLTLENGAFFTMTLTDRGSGRRGTREMVEFRTDERTVRLVDGSDYVCEGREREVRRATEHPLDPIEHAYATIFEKIGRDAPGDSRESFERTHRTMLRLAARLDEEYPE